MERQKAGIYTRRGDTGDTSLTSGIRVSKSHYRIEAIGTVDELNAIIGALQVYSPSCLGVGYGPAKNKRLYAQIQEDLFVIGSILSGTADMEIESDRIAFFEEHIDNVSAGLVPLKNFVLPGGDAEACWCHMARTVCRRAERAVIRVNEMDRDVPANVIVYLNRLSDFFFVMARKANNSGKDDVLWSRPKRK